MRRGALALLAALLAAMAAASSLLAAYAHVAYVYQASANFEAYYGEGYTPPLYFIVTSSTSSTSSTSNPAVAAVPNYCEPAKALVEALTGGGATITYKYLDYYNASFTAIAYVSKKLVGQQVSLQALLANWSTGGYLALYMPKGTLAYSAQVSPLSSGQYFTYNYTVTVPATTTTYLGQANFSPTAIHPGVWFIYSWNLTVVPTTNPQAAAVTGNVLDYLFGQTYQTSPLVYQGVSGSSTNASEPYDLSGAKAAAYWSLASISSTQPVMLLTPYEGGESGTVLWNYNYASGENVSIVGLVTFTANSSQVADGTSFYFFMVPYEWSVSSAYNESTYYYVPNWQSGTYVSPALGAMAFFGTSAYALAVEWNPWWYYIYTKYPGATGPWNIWVYKYYNGVIVLEPSPSPNLFTYLSSYYGWDGYGLWSPSPWVPSKLDYLVVCVTYDGATNTLYGFAEDLNLTLSTGTPYVADFALNLGNYFTQPGTGTYAFGFGGVTGSSYANWGALYIDISTW